MPTIKRLDGTKLSWSPKDKMLNTCEPVREQFEFLTRDFDFKGPFQWNMGHEQEFTYVNGHLYVNIGFDGGFFLSIGKTHKMIPELSTGELNIGQVDYRDRIWIDVLSLLSKKERNEIYGQRDQIVQLSSLAQLLKNNPEILQGDWRKFSILYKLTSSIRSKLSTWKHKLGKG